MFILVYPLPVMLSSLFFVPERMRFFLSIILEVSGDAEMQRVVAEHASGLCREVASRLTLEANDVRVSAFIDELRGIGVRVLMEPELARQGKILQDLARRHGLEPKAFEVE